jgi:CRISPR-associated protein Cas5d
MNSPLVTLRVWGDLACFTRPELKVERVSYPVPTPAAARGILEAVFWEPQMYYLVDAIRIVKKGRWIPIRRNEVTKVASLNPRQAPIRAGGGAPDAAQRNMLALADVEYLLTAEVHLTALADPGRDSVAKYQAEIERRARQGKCAHRPGMGMREFAADFEWEPDPAAAVARRARELNQDTTAYQEDLGLMLYDVFLPEDRRAGFRWRRDDDLAPTSPPARPRRRPGRDHLGELAQPRAAFFHARVAHGCIDCHPSRVRILGSREAPQ